MVAAEGCCCRETMKEYCTVPYGSSGLRCYAITSSESHEHTEHSASACGMLRCFFHEAVLWCDTVQ
jgi:hypothetical protein